MKPGNLKILNKFCFKIRPIFKTLLLISPKNNVSFFNLMHVWSAMNFTVHLAPRYEVHSLSVQCYEFVFTQYSFINSFRHGLIRTLDFSWISFVCRIAWLTWAGLIRLESLPDLPEQNWSCWNGWPHLPEQDWSGWEGMPDFLETDWLILLKDQHRQPQTLPLLPPPLCTLGWFDKTDIKTAKYNSKSIAICSLTRSCNL